MANARILLKLILPAVAVGILSALVLAALDLIADHWLHDLFWDTIPGWFGVTGDTKWWIFTVLTVIGFAVGLVIWLVPGHAGADPATEELVHPPEPLRVVPGLLLAAALGLGGGVSLGPEAPIMSANAAIAIALGARFAARVPTKIWFGLAAAGTIGALFGTPIAAALMLTESLAAQPAEKGLGLWDRLLAPLVAATAGGVTMASLGTSSSFTLDLPAYRGFEPIDMFSAAVVACVGVLIGWLAIWIFPRLHTLFHRLRHPVVMLTAGGVILGVLGVIGGPLTLFKGLEQINELASTYTDYSRSQLLMFCLIKVAAMVVAATAGFRGGRIFPIVFAGVALGFATNAFVPGVPLAVAIGAGVLGLTLVVTRSGWLAIFLGAALVAEPTMLITLCVAVVPAWLIVTDRKPMIAHAPAPA